MEYVYLLQKYFLWIKTTWTINTKAIIEIEGRQNIKHRLETRIGTGLENLKFQQNKRHKRYL